MGSFTRGKIVSTALLKAGDTSLTLNANDWLNVWLRSMQLRYDWPQFVQRQANVAIGTGVTDIALGNGNGGITNPIKKILDSAWLYDSTYSTKLRVFIKAAIGGRDINEDETINSPTANVSMPQRFKVRGDPSINDGTKFGVWHIIPTPVPDKAYILALDYVAMPADVSSDTTVLWYPNDRTAIQAVLVDVLQFLDDPSFENEAQILATMVQDDRGALETPGINDVVELDNNVFR